MSQCMSNMSDENTLFFLAELNPSSGKWEK